MLIDLYHGQCVGLINDDLTEVGRVHLGVVHLFDVERRRSTTGIGNHRMRIPSVEEMLADLSGFETWSQICLKALFGAVRGRQSGLHALWCIMGGPRSGGLARRCR